MSEWINYKGNQIRAEVLTSSDEDNLLVARIPRHAEERNINNLQAQQEIQIRKGQLLTKRRDSSTWELTTALNEWGSARIRRKSHPPSYQEQTVTEDQIRRDFKFTSA